MQEEQPQLTLFQFCQQNYVQMCTNGARVIGLVLGGVKVIEAQQPYTDLASGSYLMYPWVNRLEKPQSPYQPQFKDGNGLPLHGVVVNAPREITHERKQNKIVITAKPRQLAPPGLTNFVQTFTLESNKFTVNIKVIGQSQLPICFGYHPYLQINGQDLVSLNIETNISTNVQLDQKSLLPVVPFAEKDILIKATEKYDSLFKHLEGGDTYFRLRNKQGKTVEISSPDMRYWQVYTPPDRKRIAVEPMTFIGNLYSLYSEQKYGKLPKEGTFFIEVK